jgi:hypothetical protein
MSSPVAAFPTSKELLGEPLPGAVPVSIQIMANPLSFVVFPPVEGVTVDPSDSSTLQISPGSYFLNFTALSNTFQNPAVVLNTPFGQLNISPSGANTVTLPDINDLAKEDTQETFSFTFNFSNGTWDPTIVNTPDPAV